MNIIQGPDRRLLKPCRPFDFAAPEFDPGYTANLMHRTMSAANGLGLAAPQVGLDVRMFVIKTTNGYLSCFNPEVVEGVGRDLGPEGCLSFPGEFPFISRFKIVNVRFWDATGQKRDFDLSGMGARAFQHENDHLDGRTIREVATSTGVALGLKESARKRGH